MKTVTQLLKEHGYIDTTFFTPEARDRGTQIHLQTEIQDKKGGEVINPVWAKFVELYKPEWLYIEQRFIYKNISGKPDRVARINGKNYILDIKTGQKQDWWGIQLEGYRWLVEKATDLKIHGL